MSQLKAEVAPRTSSCQRPSEAWQPTRLLSQQIIEMCHLFGSEAGQTTQANE